jgi:alkylation response protein AidB-like acyl-CoA dehydrogenase
LRIATEGIFTQAESQLGKSLGADPLTTAMVIEKLSKGDLGVGITLGQTLKLTQIFQSGLNDEQKTRVLPGFAQDPRGMLAIGIAEPDNASNYLVPFPAPFRTVAVKTNGGWIVNGILRPCRQ